jgi:hypothetical protein
MGLFTGGSVVPATGGPAGAISGLKRSIPIYTLPTGTDAEAMKDIMTILTLYGKSESTTLKAWQTWVFTWVCVAFPEMEGRYRAARSTEYVFSPLPEAFIDEVSDMVTRLQSDPALELPAPNGYGFPGTTALFTTSVYNCGSIVGLYGYLSLVVHLMGKQIGAGNRDLITNRRPLNIIDKYNAQGVSYILTGRGRMSDVAHSKVKDSWDQSSVLRKVTIDEFCRLRGSDELSADVVFTMFRMLEYSHMSNAGFIRDFLDSCDWVLKDMPSMIPLYDFYVNSVYAFAAEPAQRRPYVKLYYGDNTTIFHAKTLQDLTAIAVEWLRPNNDSLTGYTAPGGDKAKAAFARLCMARGIDISSGTLSTPVIVAPGDDSTDT